MFDVHDVISDLEVAEIGKEGGDFRLLTLRARGDRVRFVEQIARAENCEVSVRKHDTIGDVSLGQRGGEDLSGKVAGFIGITFAAASAASKTE